MRSPPPGASLAVQYQGYGSVTTGRVCQLAPSVSDGRQSAAFLGLQDACDRNDRVPIPRRRPCTEEFVDLAKIADRFHVTTVHSEDESMLRCDDPQKPLAAWWKSNGN